MSKKTAIHDRAGSLQGGCAAARAVLQRKRLDQAPQETNVELLGAKCAAEKAKLAKSYWNYPVKPMQVAESMNALDAAPEFVQMVPPLQPIRKESRHEH